MFINTKFLMLSNCNMLCELLSFIRASILRIWLKHYIALVDCVKLIKWKIISIKQLCIGDEKLLWTCSKRSNQKKEDPCALHMELCIRWERCGTQEGRAKFSLHASIFSFFTLNEERSILIIIRKLTKLMNPGIYR